MISRMVTYTHTCYWYIHPSTPCWDPVKNGEDIMTSEEIRGCLCRSSFTFFKNFLSLYCCVFCRSLSHQFESWTFLFTLLVVQVVPHLGKRTSESDPRNSPCTHYVPSTGDSRGVYWDLWIIPTTRIVRLLDPGCTRTPGARKTRM